jgi:hypothetical protein
MTDRHREIESLLNLPGGPVARPEDTRFLLAENAKLWMIIEVVKEFERTCRVTRPDDICVFYGFAESKLLELRSALAVLFSEEQEGKGT